MLTISANDRDGRASALVEEVLFSVQEMQAKCLRDFQKWTEDLIVEKSYKFEDLKGTRVDIVQNVINLLAAHWVAEHLVRLNYLHIFILFWLDAISARSISH